MLSQSFACCLNSINYGWSHTYIFSFSSILVLLHVCSCSISLGPLVHSEPFSILIPESTTYFLLWLKDMQIVHPVAAWCWRLVKVLYKEHQAVRSQGYE